MEVQTTQGVPVLARVVMSVDGPIVGLNAAYRPSMVTLADGGTHATIRMTAAGKEYKARVKGHAQLALARTPLWPRDPWRVLHARVSLYAFNTNHDAGAAQKVVCDALEGVLYVDDRVVSMGEQPRACVDDRGPRLVVCVDLLEVDTEAGAEARCAAAVERKLKRG